MLRWLVTRLFRMRVTGIEQLLFQGPTVLMANHVSLIDALLLGVILPKKVCFLMNTAYAERMKWVKRLRHIVAIDPQNPYSLREVVKIVKSGTPLVVFPEGRVTVTGNMMKLYAGAAFVAVKAEATVYPIWIDGPIFSYFSRMQGKLPLRLFPRVHITIGNPFRIPIETGMSVSAMKKTAVRWIEDHLQRTAYQSRRKTNVNLYNEWLAAARTYGMNRNIVEDINGIATYKKLIQGATALSIAFRKKFDSTETVGILLPNVNAHIATLFALFRCGKTPAILNFSLGSQAIVDNCDVGSIRHVITSKSFVEKANLAETIAHLERQHIAIVYLEDVRSSITLGIKLKTLFLRGKRTKDPGKSVVLFTSGSEGKPKGVVLSHDNIYANVQQARLMIDFTTQDKMLNALPMFHSFGLTAGTILPLLCGLSVYVYPSPLHYQVICELLYDRNCTILFGTSTFLGGYARAAHGYDFRSLRYVFAGAEKLHPTVQALWQNKFGVRILEGYGTTEASPIISLNTPLHVKNGTVGRPVPGLDVCIKPVPGIDQGGTLQIKGDQVMQGYLIDGRGFVPLNDWYDTGDVVSIDAEGFITIQARLKRFAKIGGEMVSLEVCERIVNSVLQQENSVAVVVAVSDARKGEKLIAYSTEPIDADRILHILREEKRSLLLEPSIYVTVESIPLLGSGKTDYVTLSRRAQQTYGDPTPHPVHGAQTIEEEPMI